MGYYNNYNNNYGYGNQNKTQRDEIQRAIDGINKWIMYSKEKGRSDNYIRRHLLNISFDEFATLTKRDKMQIGINHVSLYAYRI